MPSTLVNRLAAALVENSPAHGCAEPHLRAVLDQAAGTPGKLVRAQLVHTAAVAHGLDDGAALRLASAVEFFHVSSLLLDDLPCMDDAQTRRGRPCPHLAHGDASVILASLSLINRAYALVGFALADQPALVRIQAQACLDACLGPSGLAGGQAADLRFNESDRSARAVSRIAVAKTGALFWLAVYLPGLIAQPDTAERRLLRALCFYWGLAFQSIDDLSDVLGSRVETGKTTGRDRALARPNLALAIGVPAARRRVARLVAQGERTVAALVARSPRWSYLAVAQRLHFAPAAGHGADGAVVAA